MLEPLRFHPEKAPAFVISRPAFCGVCLGTKAYRNDPNLAVLYCPDCIKRFQCKRCDEEMHCDELSRNHVRRLLVIGPGVRKKVIRRGDARNFPNALDWVHVKVKSRTYLEGKLIGREPPMPLYFQVGLSGPSVHVQVLGARGIPAADLGGTSDPKIVASFQGRNLGETRVQMRSLNPNWDNETFICPVSDNLPKPRDMAPNQKDMFKLELYDYDAWSGDDFLGHVEIKRQELVELAKKADGKVLKLPFTSREYHGSCFFSFGVKERLPEPTWGSMLGTEEVVEVPEEDKKWDFVLRVDRAASLDKLNAVGLSDPLCQVWFGDKLIGETPHKEDTLNPVWEQLNEFRVPMEDFIAREDELIEVRRKYDMMGENVGDRDAIFRVELFDFNYWLPNRSLGTVHIPVRAIRHKGPVPGLIFGLETHPHVKAKKKRRRKKKKTKRKEGEGEDDDEKDGAASSDGERSDDDNDGDDSSSYDSDEYETDTSAGSDGEEEGSEASQATSGDGGSSSSLRRRSRPEVEGSSGANSPQGSVASKRSGDSRGSNASSGIKRPDGPPPPKPAKPPPADMLSGAAAAAKKTSVNNVTDTDTKKDNAAGSNDDDDGSDHGSGGGDSDDEYYEEDEHGFVMKYLCCCFAGKLARTKKEVDRTEWSPQVCLDVEKENESAVTVENDERGCVMVRLIPSQRGNVVMGLDEGVRCMSLGETSTLKVRFDHAYSSYLMGFNCPPRSNIVFTVTLQKINNFGHLAIPWRQALRFFRMSKRNSRRLIMTTTFFCRKTMKLLGFGPGGDDDSSVWDGEFSDEEDAEEEALLENFEDELALDSDSSDDEEEEEPDAEMLAAIAEEKRQQRIQKKLMEKLRIERAAHTGFTHLFSYRPMRIDVEAKRKKSEEEMAKRKKEKEEKRLLRQQMKAHAIGNGADEDASIATMSTASADVADKNGSVRKRGKIGDGDDGGNDAAPVRERPKPPASIHIEPSDAPHED